MTSFADFSPFSTLFPEMTDLSCSPTLPPGGWAGVWYGDIGSDLMLFSLTLRSREARVFVNTL